MKDDRFSNHVKKDYVCALGLATFTFSSLEWEVAWCAEKISPGTLRKIMDDEMTAGKIAKKFVNITKNMRTFKEHEKLKDLACRFMELVKIRNNIMHGNPCAGSNGESRLSGKGNNIIEIPDLETAADNFAECGINLNRIRYNFLENYK